MCMCCSCRSLSHTKLSYRSILSCSCVVADSICCCCLQPADGASKEDDSDPVTVSFQRLDVEPDKVLITSRKFKCDISSELKAYNVSARRYGQKAERFHSDTLHVVTYLPQPYTVIPLITAPHVLMSLYPSYHRKWYHTAAFVIYM